MRGVLLDLDGVVYVGDEPVPGAAETVDWLAREGIPYRFLTNTTSRPRRAIVDKLAGMGIRAGEDMSCNRWPTGLRRRVGFRRWLARPG